MKNSSKGPSKGRKTIKAYFAASSGGGDFGDLALSTVMGWDGEKHRKACEEEVKMVNGLKMASCPYCGSPDFVSKGKRKDGIRRYLCNNCGKTFSPLTGTLFDSRKIPVSEWIEFLINVGIYESVSQSSMTNMNAQSTGQYWLRKTFEAIKGCQSGVKLVGSVYIDETYFEETPEGTLAIGGKKPRGLSKNLWCVSTARDESGAFCLIACGRGKPSAKRVMDALLPHIERGSTIIHDGENAHSKLIEALGGEEEIHKTSETKGMSDSENPLESVNELHRYLKKFMARHGAFDRDLLQDWLNLFYMAFSSFGNPSTFVSRVLKMAINCRKVLRYRDVMGKKAR